MKRLWFAMLAIGSICLIPRAAFAQIPTYHESDHVELGVYGEFYRFDQAGADLAEVGARASFNVTPLVQLEAEMTYDFSQGVY
jgi:hypothetical protein